MLETVLRHWHLMLREFPPLKLKGVPGYKMYHHMDLPSDKAPQPIVPCSIPKGKYHIQLQMETVNHEPLTASLHIAKPKPTP